LAPQGATDTQAGGGRPMRHLPFRLMFITDKAKRGS
jgi:hypothetical protein